MIKKLILSFIVLVSFLLLIVIYLTFFGVKTKKLNNKIETEITKINKDVNIELKSITIFLDPLNFSINLKTLGPKVLIKNTKIELEYIKSNVSLKTFLNGQFKIDDLQISTKAIKISNLITLARSFKNSAELFILDNIIKDGFLVGDVVLNFDKDGNIKNDYQIKGFIKKGKLNFLKRYSIDNLNFNFDLKSKEYYLKDLVGNFNKIRLSSNFINVKEIKNQFLVEGNFNSQKINSNSKIIKDLFEKTLKKYGVKSIDFTSDNNFSFNLSKKFKVNNFNLKSIINLEKLLFNKKSLNIKKYLPAFEDLVQLENHKIFIDFKKDYLSIEGKGKIAIEKKVDNLKYKIIKKGEHYVFDTSININKNPLSIDALEYEKKKDLASIVKLNGTYKENKQIEFNQISFFENNNTFLINNLNLDKNFKILNLKLLKINYINKNQLSNVLTIKKKLKRYEIYGKSFDASKLIEKILDNNDKDGSSSVFKDLNSIVNIKIKKTYLNKNEFVNDLNGQITFNNNKINQLDLKSFFPNNRKLTLTINTNKKNEKITTLFSDYPKPLVKQYKFVKGFEEGVLDFYSVTKNDTSNSVLVIDDFKLQEVPILAKLLTLASLQGISDLLTGEGIRFTDFEMKFSNNKGLMTIDELYAIGPAISILLDGYIESKKTISLRGTLVPATTINRTIASIPLIGDLLVGKKVGEGVFGVSFKVKGPPENIKTTVNPVKTLTPRFITRTLEKIKKN